MLNVIIYEDNKVFMQKNINCINMAFGGSDIEYRIHRFLEYNDNLKNLVKDKNIRKIYILDIEMKGNTMSGLELASMIRESDYSSIIIFATAFDKYQKDVFYTRLMALDFICKYNGYEKRLVDDLKASLSILYDDSTFVFKYNYVAYCVPYSHINYIEKEPLIKRCIIHATDRDYYIVNSINRLSALLGNGFLKTHQSCIINLNNIKKVDFSLNEVIFKNGDSTSLITEKTKKDIKNYVGIGK